MVSVIFWFSPSLPNFSRLDPAFFSDSGLFQSIPIPDDGGLTCVSYFASAVVGSLIAHREILRVPAFPSMLSSLDSIPVWHCTVLYVLPRVNYHHTIIFLHNKIVLQWTGDSWYRTTRQASFSEFIHPCFLCWNMTRIYRYTQRKLYILTRMDM